MAKKAAEAKSAKPEKEKKQGSGSWMREQLLKPNFNKTDQALADEARTKFGGNTGPSDVAWNRNKLRREGLLPPVERKPKEKKAKKAKKDDASAEQAA